MTNVLSAITDALRGTEPETQPSIPDRVRSLLGRPPIPPLTAQAIARVVEHAGGPPKELLKRLRELDGRCAKIEAELDAIARVSPGTMRQQHLDTLTARLLGGRSLAEVDAWGESELLAEQQSRIEACKLTLRSLAGEAAEAAEEFLSKAAEAGVELLEKELGAGRDRAARYGLPSGADPVCDVVASAVVFLDQQSRNRSGASRPRDVLAMVEAKA